MRVINFDAEAALEVQQVESYHNTGVESSLVTHKSYRELEVQTVIEVDCLAQLHANLEMLSDVQARWSFVMREIRYLMKV